MANPEKNAVLFSGLIGQYHAMAWIALGKTPNPATNKIERNLEMASFYIDVLLMIREKTKGNLSDPEKRELENTISMLQMNFVQEKNGDTAAAGQQEERQPEAPAAETTSASSEDAPPTPEEEPSQPREDPTPGAGPTHG